MSRPRDERVARALGAAALAAAFMMSLLQSGGRGDDALASKAVRVDARNADSSAWMARTIVATIARDPLAGALPAAWPTFPVTMAALPSATSRAILGDAALAGLPVQWVDSLGMRDLSVSAAAATTPQPATLLSMRVRSPDSATALVLRDAGGIVDSSNQAALRVRATSTRAPVKAEVWRNGQRIASARADAPDAPRIGRVRLFAQPGWESKFVVTALEESGWTVDGTLAISPKASVQLGIRASLDTLSHSVAVVLDSGVVDVRAVRSFVASGGGLVIAGEALRDPALASLGVARITHVHAPIAGALLTDEPRQGLSAYHLDPLPGATVLEGDSDESAVVVVRRGLGRVLAVGYRETWRWRMEGRDESADAHRQYWTQLLAAVAYASSPRTSLPTNSNDAVDAPGDGVPLADLIARVGQPSSRNQVVASSAALARIPLWWLYVVAAISLTIEWALRRTRGAP